jgi:hypothetical protein
VARVEQAEQAARLREVEALELRAIPDVGAARVALLPLGREVAAVRPLAALPGLLGVRPLGRQELRAAAAEHHLDAVATCELDQLTRDVGDAGGLRLVGQIGVALPVALGRVRVAGARRRVRDARGRHDAGREAAALRVFEQRRDAAPCDAAGVADAREVREPEHAGLGLHARHHRGHRARRIGHLRVRVVGLREREEGELLEGEQVLLTG